MGAVPKNKITRAERGKRRAGNKPSLTKNLSQAGVPLHKRGLVAQIFSTIGLSSPVATQPAPVRRSSAQSKTSPAATQSKNPVKAVPNKTKKASPAQPTGAKISKPSKQRPQKRG